MNREAEPRGLEKPGAGRRSPRPLLGASTVLRVLEWALSLSFWARPTLRTRLP